MDTAWIQLDPKKKLLSLLSLTIKRLVIDHQQKHDVKGNEFIWKSPFWQWHVHFSEVNHHFRPQAFFKLVYNYSWTVGVVVDISN